MLRNEKKIVFRIAPLLGRRLSLLCSCWTEDDLRRFEVMEDKPILSVLGSCSAMENEKLIPQGGFPKLNRLHEGSRGELLQGLERILSPNHLNKNWKRWCCYEDFCNTR